MIDEPGAAVCENRRRIQDGSRDLAGRLDAVARLVIEDPAPRHLLREGLAAGGGCLGVLELAPGSTIPLGRPEVAGV
jgi:hypothetical protein